MKGQIGPNKIKVEHFNSTISSLVRSSTMKITKGSAQINNMIEQ